MGTKGNGKTNYKGGKGMKGTKGNTGHRMDAYQIITDRIIELLNKGVVPWHKPWSSRTTVNGVAPRAINLKSKKAYRGINAMLLPHMGYNSPYWVSYKQAQELGGSVRKGERATPVVFWKWLVVDDEEDIDPDTNQPRKKGIPYLRYYSVFNVEQCEGLEDKIPHEETPETPEIAPQEFSIIDACEAIIEGYSDKPEITHVGDSACYSPHFDYIHMPAREKFDSPEEYYNTLFHEGIHSTGHKTRVGRFNGDTDETMFGSASYSEEELVAEMGASYLSGYAGIVETTIDNSASYIDGWLKRLQNDKKFVVFAAARAQKAAEYILNIKHDEEGE